MAKKIGPILVYGKGKAMASLCGLLDYFQLSYTQMDDADADIELIKKAKIIIATPGIKPSHRLYTTYQHKIVSELSFLGLLIKNNYLPRWHHINIIGITGTNGKSTTTRALYQACQLLEEKKPTHERHDIYIGGNFDLPLSGIILDILQSGRTKQDSIIILECSSFMLWKLQNFQFKVGVLLNIAPDHIDRHGSMKDYLQAKVNILTNAKHAITTAEIKDNIIKDQMRGISLLHRLRPYGRKSTRPIQWESYEPLHNLNMTQFFGTHNAANFGAVDSTLRHLYGNYDKHIFHDIKPVAHRLDPIPLTNGLTIIDDSVSSSSHALGAAIQAMDKPALLISGGYDNGENYESLRELLHPHIQIAIFYGQTRIHLYPLAKQVISEVMMVETLQEALEQAWIHAKKHNLTTILYSPGAKSFDQFDNVYHRIQTFEDLIAPLRLSQNKV